MDSQPRKLLAEFLKLSTLATDKYLILDVLLVMVRQRKHSCDTKKCNHSKQLQVRGWKIWFTFEQQNPSDAANQKWAASSQKYELFRLHLCRLRRVFKRKCKRKWCNCTLQNLRWRNPGNADEFSVAWGVNRLQPRAKVWKRILKTHSSVLRSLKKASWSQDNLTTNQ